MECVPSEYHSYLFPWLTPTTLKLHGINNGISAYTLVACDPAERISFLKFLSDHGLIALLNTTWEFHDRTLLKGGKHVCESLVFLPNLAHLKDRDLVFIGVILTKWCRSREPSCTSTLCEPSCTGTLH